MKKLMLFIVLCFTAILVNAQIEVDKLTGKDYTDYNVGFGAFLKVSHPVSDASYINAEFGVIAFSSLYGDVALLPMKLGYRYTLNGSGAGFYIEPQLGYTIGASDYDDIKGFTWAAGTGYLFQPWGRVQLDLGIRYESVIASNGSVNYIGLRLSHNFVIGRRE